MDILSIYPSEEHNEELDLIRVVDEFQIFSTVADGELVFLCIVGFLWQSWNKPWSPVEFLDEMEEIENDFPEIGRTYKGSSGSDEYQAVIQFPFRSWENRFLDELEENWNTTKRFIEAVEKSLQAKLDDNALVSHFAFPPAFQGACEEYLWSFIQFLRDVGVEAIGELKHEKGQLGKVLFSVTPSRGKEALGKVKQALDLYISLAGVTDFEVDTDNSLDSIVAERLQARLYASK